MKNIYIKTIILVVIAFCFLSCLLGKNRYNTMVKRKLKNKYKESFVIIKVSESKYYEGDNALEQFINSITLKKPDYCKYSYTISPKKNEEIKFFAWMDSRYQTVSDSYYNEKLKYQVQEYVFSIISPDLIPRESLKCYVNFDNDVISSSYEDGLLSITEIIKIENDYNAGGLNIEMDFDLDIISKNKESYIHELYKLYSNLIKNYWKKFTALSIKTADGSVYITLNKNKSKDEFYDLVKDIIY